MRRTQIQRDEMAVSAFVARGRAASAASLKGGQRTAGKRACAHCGSEFEAWAGRPASRFCSRECTRAFQKAEAAATYPPREEVERLYQELRSIEAVARHYGHAADWGKRVLAHHKIAEVVRVPIIVTCAECGIEVRRSPSEIRKYKKVYCSGTCYHASDRRPPEAVEALSKRLSETRMGQANPGYKHGKSPQAGRLKPREWHLKIKGEEFCRNCGAPATNLHHIVPRSKSKTARKDVERNGLPLCYPCHRGWHDRTVTIPHDVLTDAEFLHAADVAGVLWVERNYPERPEWATVRYFEIAGGRDYRSERPEVFDERHARLLDERAAA